MTHLRHGDFRDYFDKLTPNFFAAVITDPFYARRFLHLWQPLGALSRHVLKPSGWFVSYCAQYIFPDVLTRVGSELDYYWFGMSLYTGMNPPGYWKKRQRVVSYGKPWVVFNKPPQRQPRDWFHDFIRGERIEKDLFDHQQSLTESRLLIRYFTKPGDWILDPCLGSGTVLEAAALEGRHAVGLKLTARPSRLRTHA